MHNLLLPFSIMTEPSSTPGIVSSRRVKRWLDSWLASLKLGYGSRWQRTGGHRFAGIYGYVCRRLCGRVCSLVTAMELKLRPSTTMERLIEPKRHVRRSNP